MTWHTNRRLLNITPDLGPPHVHTGVRGRHEIQRSRVANRIRAAKRCLDNLQWSNVNRPNRDRSLDLGPGGHIGKAGDKPTHKYPGARARSVQSAADDEDYAGHFTWVCDYRNALRPPNLLDYVASEPCVYREFRFTYKLAWYAASAFANGFYNFSFLPFFYELLRRIIREQLDYAHLFAPVWLVDETYHILRKRPTCSCRSLPRAGSAISGCFAFDGNRKSVMSCTDAHVAEFLKWVLPGGCFRVTTQSYTPEARAGRFFWEPEGTTYWAGSSSSSYHASGWLRSSTDV